MTKRKTGKAPELLSGNNRALKTIKNKSGASLLFVLAISFLLLAVGISVLVAAGAGRGAVSRQTVHNQVLLLEGSVHSVIRRSLENATDDNSLGVQIVKALYEADAASPVTDPPGELPRNKLGTISLVGNIGFGPSGFNIMAENDHAWVTDVTIEFEEQSVVTTISGEPPNPWPDPNNPGNLLWNVYPQDRRSPRKSVIAAKINVTVEIETRLGNTVVSTAVYDLKPDMYTGPDGKSVPLPIYSDDTDPPHACWDNPRCWDATAGAYVHVYKGGPGSGTINFDDHWQMINDRIKWELVSRGDMIGSIPE